MSPPATYMRWRRAWTLALPLYWVALFTATHYPRVQIPGQLTYRDKLVHFTAFGLLALLYWQFARARDQLSARFVWLAGAVLIPYAALDEYLQQFFSRFTDIYDFAANATGIVTMLLVLELVRRRRTAAAT